MVTTGRWKWRGGAASGREQDEVGSKSHPHHHCLPDKGVTPYRPG